MSILGGPRSPELGSYLLDGVELSPLAARELARVRNEKIGFVFQPFHLLRAHQRARERRAAAPLRRGVRAASGTSARARRWSAVGLGHREHHHPEPALGRAAAARRDRARARQLARDRARRRADRETSTRRSTAEIMGFLQGLNDAGVTIVLVTHEPDVAAYAKRRVVLRDGRIELDEPVVERTLAGATAAPVAGGAP
jgi:putative ABC transport system ATP-binding protein